MARNDAIPVRLLRDNDQLTLLTRFGGQIAAGRFDTRSSDKWRPKFDAGETQFKALALTYIEEQMYATLVPPLLARTFIPTTVKGNPGDETTTYYRQTRTGIARLITGRSVDLTRSSFYVEPITHKVVSIGTSFEFNYFDLLAVGAALANHLPVDLVGENMRSGLESIEKRLDIIAAFGTATLPSTLGYELEQDADPGLVGLFNVPSAASYTIATGAAGSQTWALKTCDEILADLNGIVGSQVATTYAIHRPDTIIVPILQYEQQLQRRMSDVSGESVISFFLRTRRESGHEIQVHPWMYASSAVSSTDAIVAFKRDPRLLEHMLLMDATPIASYQEGLRTITPIVARTAGVIARYPLSVSIGAGI